MVRVSLVDNKRSNSHLRQDEGIVALAYEQAMEGRRPLSVTVPPPRAPPSEEHPALRNLPSLSSLNPSKRDSILESTNTRENTGTDTRATNNKDNNNNHATNKEDEEEKIAPTTASSVRSSTWQNPQSREGPGSTNTWRKKTEKNKKAGTRLNTASSSQTTTTDEFSPITTEIPTDSLLDMDFIQGMSFSKRGSIMFGGKKAVKAESPTQKRPTPARRQPILSMNAATNGRVLSSEVEEESLKVRSMYESTESPPLNWRDGRVSALGEVEDIPEEVAEEGKDQGTRGSDRDVSNKPSSTSTLTNNRESLVKNEHELAGGLEDWEDIQGESVDRYGFICTREDGDTRPGTAEPTPPQRVSTILKLASHAPRQHRGLLGRAASSARSSRSAPRKLQSRKLSVRSLQTIDSDTTLNRRKPQPFRSAVNHLPGNQHRRWLDEAGDMLTLPPGLADIAENEEGGKAVEALKLKEWARAEKWRKMAKVVKNGKEGEGMDFEFDVKSSKLIERTWKGIPDRWRATAWFSFLSASAKNSEYNATDDEIIDAFHRLLDKGSADDTQIDIDVPRTINCHIMFRRRYRGGQRLLFRVLHCLSLYFPETGYVQGMASLAATLLCYYDEEKAFIMLVRMWQLRGLDKLYAAGFGGYMSAIDEFHKHWLPGSEVAKQLAEWNIDPTAYCTRWYLTLFNYSIPFPAQLRVWDVFMLLGDADPGNITAERPFGGCLDIIHATGAALIEGTREIVLGGDYDNAMKVLTSWIPVKDEELLMNITKVKWKMHHGKRSKTLGSKASTSSKTSV